MRWLHLSDIHYQNGDYSTERVRSRLIKCMKRLGELDFVLLTGDSMYRHELDDDCVSFLRKLVRECGSKECQVYSCPGNHDVRRDDARRNEAIKKVLDSGEPLKRDDTAYLSRHGYEEYEKFHKEVTGREFDHFRVSKGKSTSGNYRVISLDTCLLSLGNDSGKLRVMNPELNVMQEGIRDDGLLNVLIMHHGIDYLDEGERAQFEHWLDDAHIDAVFCGHSHRASIRTFDETTYSVKQFTAGSAQFISYDVPAAYVCEYDSSRCSLDVSLLAYYREIDDWEVGVNLLRSFREGRHSSVVQRLYKAGYEASVDHPVSATAIGTDCQALFDRLEDRYIEAYGSSIISVRSGESNTFSIDTVMRSVLNAGVPVQTALAVVSRGIENLVNDSPLHLEAMNTSVLRDYIYKSICMIAKGPNVSSSDLKSWSSRYARRYRQSEERFTIIKGDERINLSFSSMKSLVINPLIEEMTGVPGSSPLLSSNEKSDMIRDLLSLIDDFDCQELEYGVLYGLAREISTRLPHPWFCLPERRNELIDYNAEKLITHLEDLESGSAMTNTFNETVYHASAIYLLVGGSALIGNRDSSPFRMLYEGFQKAATTDRTRYFRKVTRNLQSANLRLDQDYWFEVRQDVNRIESYRRGDIDPLELSQDETLRDFGNRALELSDKYLSGGLTAGAIESESAEGPKEEG